MAGKNDHHPKQVQIFKDTARALGCDEDKERFEAQLRKIATHKPISTKKKERVRNGTRGRSGG